jgi:hypothetical protein
MPDSSSFSWPYFGLLEHKHPSLLSTKQWSVEWFSFIFREINVATFALCDRFVTAEPLRHTMSV